MTTFEPLGINKSFMAASTKDRLSKDFRVESVNTGRIWCFQTVDELERFFFGRNRDFYRVFKRQPLNRHV